MSHLRKKHKKKRTGLKVFLIILAVVIIVSLVSTLLLGLLAFSGANMVVQMFADLPDINDFSPAESALTSKIYAADGTLIGTFHSEENRELVSLEQVPESLKNAIIAIEDERFYEHQGFDIEGIARAMLINLQSGSIEQGASTISQQVIDYLYIPEEKEEMTYIRKLREAALAYQLEQIFTKNEVLEIFMNTVYFGEGSYSVQSAAKAYFNKDVEYLSIPEAAMIAGVIRNPYYYSPYVDEKAALERRNTVLSKMRELEFITEAEYEDAIATPIITQRPLEEEQENYAPYFIEYVKQYLIDKYGVNNIFEGGYSIYTTLDRDMQYSAERAIEEILPDPEDPAAALVSIDPSNGYIKAMVGGKDFNEMKFNLATQAKRQPGSTFKVFALLAALQQGISPQMTFNPNGTVVFDIEGSEPWEVSNYKGEQYEVSELPIIEATVKSINVVYSQLIMKVGAYSIAKIAEDMGITTDLNAYPAIGLGGLTTGVSTLEVCSSFCTLANYGEKNDPVAVLKVVDNKGIILEEHETQPTRVLPAINAYRAIEIMQQVMQRGTGTRARLDDRPCAGKTGTTQEAENAWFTGFTTNLATCVWMGYPEENVEMGVIHDMVVQGGAHPAMIWNLFMTEATKDLPIENFERPEDDIIDAQVVINPETGEMMLPNRFTPMDQITIKQFKYGTEPTTIMPISQEDFPVMPNVSLMSINEANHILIENGLTHIEYVTEPYGEVPPGYTHRQDPVAGAPVETIRKIKIFVNP